MAEHLVREKKARLAAEPVVQLGALFILLVAAILIWGREPAQSADRKSVV